MKRLFVSTIIGSSFACMALVANAADTVVVPGTSDPWLADQPSGTSASLGDGVGDYAPAQSPVLAGLVNPGGVITWSATGAVGNGPSYEQAGPNGDVANVNGFGLIDHSAGAQKGISDILNIPIDSLLGVFVGSTVPAGTAPVALDFGSIGLTYTTLAPVVDQVFYMGDGSVQSVTVPTGATELFLGSMDGFGWDNNTGSFTVSLQEVTPVPDGSSTMMLLGAAFGLLGMARRSRQLAA